MKIDFDADVHWNIADKDIRITDVTIGGLSILKAVPKEELQNLVNEIKGDSMMNVLTNASEAFHLQGIDVEVDYSYKKGREARFSPSFGNWLPGDPGELNIKSIMCGGSDIKDVLPEKTLEMIDRKIADESMEEADVSKRYRNAIERTEKRLEKATQGGKMVSKLGKKGKSVIPGFSHWFKR